MYLLIYVSGWNCRSDADLASNENVPSIQCFGTGLRSARAARSARAVRGELGVLAFCFALFAAFLKAFRSSPLEPDALSSFQATMLQAHPLEPCSIPMDFDASRPQCARPIRSSPLESIAFKNFRATVLEANPLEPARANCSFKLQGHHAPSISARAR